MFRKTMMAAIAAATLGSGVAQAQTSPHSFSANIGLFSQYIFRGLTQTNGDPAVQGGVDYSHASGFYLGTWASNISWLKENATQANGATIGLYGSGGNVEIDFYGGYKWQLTKDVTVDIGTLYYYYPGSISETYRMLYPAGTDIPKADTWELYYALAWKWLSFKLSYSLMDETFGVADSNGSAYFDLTANIPLTKQLTLNAHIGKQTYGGTDRRNAVAGASIRNNQDVYGYTDYKIGVSYALPRDFTVGAFYSKADNADICGYGGFSEIGVGCTGPYPKNIAKETGTVFIQKTF
jgi:uncharacterized protein (TIGR02001 family)